MANTPSHVSQMASAEHQQAFQQRALGSRIKRNSVFFQTWFFEKYDAEDISKMHRNETWGSETEQARLPFEMLGNDLIALRERFEALSDYEQETINDLRNRGVSIPDLVDYMRAEPGFNAEGKPVRKDVASHLRKKEFLEKSSRIESLGRSAAIAAGSLAMLGVAGATLGSGMFPQLVVATDFIPKIWDVATNVVQTAAGGGLMLLSWKTWQEFNSLKQSVPRLDLGGDSSFKDLPNSIGNLNYTKVNEQYESIPDADQHLIKHLSPTELRMFLTGKDPTRLHILRANPPTSWSQIQSRLVPLVQKDNNRIKSACRALGSLMSAPWRREKNNARIPDLKKRLEEWREFAQINKRFTRGGESPELILTEKQEPLPRKSSKI